MTIASQNEKTYRPSMMVACGVDTYADQLTVMPTTRYGSGVYDGNMRAGKRGLTIKLMDLAGDGFALDGTHYPIRSTSEVDDGDSAIVDSYKGYVKYGIPAATASNSSTGLTSDIGFSVDDIPTDAETLTAHLKDSEGNNYRATASSAGDLLTAIKAVAIVPGARLYVDRIAAGESWQWDKSSLISCSLVLRGVETKGDSPELQMSEVEVKGIIPDSDIDDIAEMNENSPIWYVAGYQDDVTPVRRFYLSDGITTENIVATVKGYDATKFLQSEHHGVVSTYSHGKFNYGEYMYRMARRCYAILGRGLIYDHSAEFARDPVNDVRRAASYDPNVRYMSMNKLERRTVIAAHCNLMRVSSGGYDDTGVYCDYVDAGLPTMRAGIVPIGETSYGNEWDLSLDDVSGFEAEAEVAIAEISAQVAWPKRETNDKGAVKRTSFYAETLQQGEARPVETEEPYSGIAFKEYDTTEKENANGSKKWYHSKIGNLFRVMGHYYPDRDSFGSSAFLFRIKAIKSAKQRITGVRNVMTNPNSLTGLPTNAVYEDGTLTYTTGKKGDTVTLPDVFKGTLKQAQSVSGTTASSVYSMWGPMLKQIGDRSNIVYKFNYRGNPRMQPRDIIHMDIDGTTVDMTVDNITLEHSKGGLTSSIECRKGVI